MVVSNSSFAFLLCSLSWERLRALNPESIAIVYYHTVGLCYLYHLYTFPVDFIVGVVGLAHYHAILFAELDGASEAVRFARILPAKVKAPSDLV